MGGVRLPRTQHAAGGQLCRAVETAAQRVPRVPAGVAALRYRGVGDAALGTAQRRRGGTVVARPRTAFPRELSRQFPVLDLHALWRAVELSRFRRRGDGRDSGRGGVVVAPLSARTDLGA